MLLASLNLTEPARTLFEESGDALLLFDPEPEQLLEVNRMAEELSGFSRTTLLRMSVPQLIRSESPSGIQRLRQAARRTGVFHSQDGFYLRHQREGLWVPVKLSVTRLQLGSGTYILLTARDMTERRDSQLRLKKADVELQHLLATARANAARYRSVLENLEQCVFLKDSEFRFVAVNPPFCRAVGKTEAEIVGRTDFDFYPEHLAKKFREDDLLVLRDGQRINVEEESLVASQARTVRVVKTPVREEPDRIVGVLGIFWDVTDQRSLEAQLRQSQKMEAIGQLAGGVAHDFNNLLTVILGNLALLGYSLRSDVPSNELLRAAESAALRAANLTGQLLGFARRTLMRPEPMNLQTLVDEVVSLFRRTIDPRIQLVVQTQPDLWPVLADAGQINQVLVNLCLNARDAMPDGGELRLQTQNVVLRGDNVQHSIDARSGEFVCLKIRDTGTGMSEQVRQHLYEPFFTTKGLGKGTGLGLATVFGIVKQHQGWIECDSEPGRGTQFRIYLPRHRLLNESINQSGFTRPDSLQLKGSETILFVDDEATLRSLGQKILQRHGYRVLLAADGCEALEVFQREQGSIDLVVLDLTMPRLSGQDTFRELRRMDARVPVLLASGYSTEQLTAEDQNLSAGFVAKPYRPYELSLIIRETLDSARSEARP